MTFHGEKNYKLYESSSGFLNCKQNAADYSPNLSMPTPLAIEIPHFCNYQQF